MLADFGDWLSPMLVKELRQGLMSWFFVIGFILLAGGAVVRVGGKLGRVGAVKAADEEGAAALHVFAMRRLVRATPQKVAP